MIKFDGFLKVYQEDLDDEEDEDGARLPASPKATRSVPIRSTPTSISPSRRRAIRKRLIKKMEELGIGRPSTYASILTILRDRGYVRLDKKRLMPEDKGRVVTAFLESFFAATSNMISPPISRRQLDRISNGEIDWKDVLRDFWRDFTAAVGEIKDLRVTQVLDALNDMLGPHIFPAPRTAATARLPVLRDGQLALKLGKFGSFVGCSNYPECRFTRQLAESGGAASLSSKGKPIGIDPESGLEVTLRSGRFGPYLQLGENGGEKPKRASIPKGTDPREHRSRPRARAPVAAARGGPSSGERQAHYRGLRPLRALRSARRQICEPRARPRKCSASASIVPSTSSPRRRRAGAGVAPGDQGSGRVPGGGGTVQVLSGRYGPYVKHGKVNATLPKDRDPEQVTLLEAVELIAARAAKGPAKKPARKATKAKKPKKEKVAVEETAS